MTALSFAAIIIAGIASATYLVVHDHPVFALLVILLAGSVSMKDAGL